MTQVIQIHGGTTFANYDDYMKSLSSSTLHPERMTFKPMWRELLQQNLGDDYQVLLPAMPNKTNARYSEWKVWFTHLTDIIEDDCILIGHSMGAIFLAKYLSENKFPRTIKATILIAAPYDDESEEDLTDFKIDSVTEQFTSQAGRVEFFFGSDDPVIPLAEMSKFQHDVPGAKYHILSAPDHFVRPDFPELIDVLKSATK